LFRLRNRNLDKRQCSNEGRESDGVKLSRHLEQLKKLRLQSAYSDYHIGPFENLYQLV
jgi:hypothetical protein